LRCYKICHEKRFFKYKYEISYTAQTTTTTTTTTTEKNRVLVGKPEVKYNFEDLGLEGRIILKWTFKSGRGAWTELIWLRIGRGGELYVSGNELPLSIECGEFRD